MAMAWQFLLSSPLIQLAVVAAGIYSLLRALHGSLMAAKRGKSSFMAATKKLRLPPGPRGLPILGSLPMLGQLPHQTLHRWASTVYGPIMYTKLGQSPVVVVSSPQAAKSFLKTHDQVFASRPITEFGRIMTNNFKAISLTPYGPYWRQIRKLCTLELLSSAKVESFHQVRIEEVNLAIRYLVKEATHGATVNLSKMLASLSRDVISRIVLGRKFADESLGYGGFKAVIDELVHIAGVFNLADFIPWTKGMDLQGLGKRMRVFNETFNQFFDNIIDEHLNNKGEKNLKHHEDFTDILLTLWDSNDYGFQFDRSNIKAILLEMIAAAMDTTSTTIEWTLSELLRHPCSLRKAQEELEAVVGRGRLVDEPDLQRLEYLDMVIKESMRLHPPLPLLFPRESMEDSTVDGYHIPKGSRVLINAWAISRDPGSWPSPYEFRPERFFGSSVDVRGRDLELLPFGSGRRGCPGMQMGLRGVRLVLAQLLHCFDWELPYGMSPSDLDMNEKSGLVTHRAQSLLAIPTHRLNFEMA